MPTSQVGAGHAHLNPPGPCAVHVQSGSQQGVLPVHFSFSFAHWCRERFPELHGGSMRCVGITSTLTRQRPNESITHSLLNVYS